MFAERLDVVSALHAMQQRMAAKVCAVEQAARMEREGFLHGDRRIIVEPTVDALLDALVAGL